MTADRSLPTSPTLLGRLGCVPTDQAAWGAFAERYGRKIYGWCRHWQVQEADAEDVTQQSPPRSPPISGVSWRATASP